MFGHPPNEQRPNQSGLAPNPEVNSNPIFGNQSPSGLAGPQSNPLQLSSPPRKQSSVENRNNTSRAGSHDGRVNSKSHGADVMMHEESKGPPVSQPFPCFVISTSKAQSFLSVSASVIYAFPSRCDFNHTLSPELPIQRHTFMLTLFLFRV